LEINVCAKGTTRHADATTSAKEQRMSKSRVDLDHSPGPWRWAENGKDLLDANGRKLVSISDLERDADANIIVAAPTLVAACKRVLQALRSFGPTADSSAVGREVELAADEVRDALIFAKYGELPGEAPDLFEER
jgi:hypothetical protein